VVTRPARPPVETSSPEIQPRRRGLPTFAPTPPPGGWTTHAAAVAAVAYADNLASRPDLGTRRALATLALQAITATVPGLHHTRVAERLGGVDALSIALGDVPHGARARRSQTRRIPA
jgi:hypothetical protein